MKSKLSKKLNDAVRLQDIADRAETSVATVSMALAGSNRVSTETRERIRRLSQQMGYTPRRSISVAIRRQAMSRRKLSFGFLVVGAMDAPSNAAFLRILSDAASRQDIRIEVAEADPDKPGTNPADRAIQLGKTLDGLIIMGPITLTQLQQVQLARVPAVMCGYPFDAADADTLPATIITNDWQAMGHRATRHLIEKGHRHIGFISGHIVPGMWHERCLDGYTLALIHAGRTPSRRHVFVIPGLKDIHHTLATTRTVVSRILAMKQPPTAFVIVNNGNAQRLRSAMIEQNHKLTTDIATVTHIPDPLLHCAQFHMDLPAVTASAIAQLKTKCINFHTPNTIQLVPFACNLTGK